MKYIYYAIAVALIYTNATAHELTPTYPKMRPSYIEDVSVTQMKMWNRREDVLYYEIGVFDEEWKPVAFASENKILQIAYLGRTTFDLYVRDSDLNRIKYICTTSKQLKQDVKSTGIKSRICSKVK